MLFLDLETVKNHLRGLTNQLLYLLSYASLDHYFNIPVECGQKPEITP
jgi:hypothetical protein